MTSTTPAAGGALPNAVAGDPRPAVLEVRDLVTHFSVTAGAVFRREVGRVHAVDGVSFVIHRGETMGLVGESGCGKSTVARSIVRLVRPSGGEIRLNGRDVLGASPRDVRALRRDMQIVFQDPFASLDPRMRVRAIVSEPLEVHGLDNPPGRVEELLGDVGLSADLADRYPHEFSGGQRQRIAIARAIATRPNLVVCDELVSALDVSIRAQILNLLVDLQQQIGMAYLLISHDLSVVRDVADVVAVMYLGKVVELAPTHQLYDAPRHPYTVALLSAVPVPDPPRERARRRVVLGGEIPSATSPPAACRFHTRCWKAEERCRTVEPPLVADAEGHWVACHFPERAPGPM
ncbi:MAG TPA: oligopeptide/dipeptide ABC transporter ATP-binding protein [Candidatus Dormibacteraeota bacterium]|nr:oligopeptide/dipeptide ABC transporter ATP-binding protein [Candidatus Dormibacteraeota bacterium]